MGDYCGPIRDLTRDLIHISFTERTFQLPPQDPPVTVHEVDSHHNTIKLTGGGTYAIRDEIKALGGIWSKEWKMWVFQEVASTSSTSANTVVGGEEPNQGKWRELLVPSTVPSGTHDALLKMLGGVQRVDLPLWVRTPIIKKGDDDLGSEADDNEEEPPRRVTRAETKRREELAEARKRKREEQAAVKSDGGSCCTPDTEGTPFNSRHPKIVPIEARVFPSLEKGVSGDLLKQLLKARDSTSSSGTKSSLARSLKYMYDAAGYHTSSYRKFVYGLVMSGNLKLYKLTEDGASVGSTVATTEEALRELPWDAKGNIRTVSHS